MTNNKTIKRLIVRIVYERGPLTKNSLIGYLQERLGNVNRTEGSISSLLAKNTQIVRIGTVREPNKYGRRIATPQYDVDRDLIQSAKDIVYTTPLSLMSPQELEDATRCPKCHKVRVLPEDSPICLNCQRLSAKTL
jgi:hypothetical protein